jgi:uncharacterized LabA/DUF88 family protein
MNELKDKCLAVLIDAENISARNIKNMLIEISRYGTPTIKRIYGDWTKPDLVGWKNSLLEHAITPMQQYGYTSGKNSSDSAMIIDAMDILYTGNVDGFCIVSSDSDFTRLAVRLREAGKVVYGIGEKKTPISFIAACSKFIFLEILGQSEPVPMNAVKETQSGVPSGEKGKTPALVTDAALPKIPDKMVREDLKNLISQSVSDLADEDGWAYLAAVGAHINKKQPEFDPRNYGFQRLTPLLRSLKVFELEERITGTSKTKQIYVRNIVEEPPKPKRRRRGVKPA